MAFIWSRSKVIDEDTKKGQSKLRNLSFYDFLEALIHIATMKSMPNKEELQQEGVADAGLFFNKLQVEGRYAAWMATHSQRWDEPPRQPIALALEQLIILMIRFIEDSSGGNGDGDLTLAEARSFVVQKA